MFSGLDFPSNIGELTAIFTDAVSHFGWWLKDDDARSESHKMALERAPDDALKIYPVSDLVNSPKTDDPRCIEPVRIEREFFERQWWGDG